MVLNGGNLLLYLTNILDVYPNPANKYFNIELENGNYIKNIEICDILGNKLLIKNINKFEKNIFIENVNLASGMYIIAVKTISGILYEKLNIVNGH